MMRWLNDSDILIEGERGNPFFEAWSTSGGEFATADIVRTEYLLGVHAVVDAAKRRRGEQFYAERIAGMVSLSNEPQDYEAAARMAGEARR
jgi:predicted nucleic acid-binding protein